MNRWNNARRVTMRTVGAVMLALFLVPGSASAQVNYQGIWWNSSMSGMGINMGQQGNVIAVAWYLFGSDGESAFLTFAGPLVDDVVNADLYRSSGPLPGPGYDPDDVSHQVVGTATVLFTGPNTATLTYNYDGLSGSMELSRFTFRKITINEFYSGAYYLETTGCQTAILNGLIAVAEAYHIVSDATTLQMIEYFSECVYSGNVEQKGNHFTGSGTWSCPDGSIGTWESSDIEITPQSIVVNFEGELLVPAETCQYRGRLGGIAQGDFEFWVESDFFFLQ